MIPAARLHTSCALVIVLLAIETCAVRQINRGHSEGGMKQFTMAQLVVNETDALKHASSKSNMTGGTGLNQSVWTSVAVEDGASQTEYELHVQDTPVVSKVVLVLLEVSFLGFCGVDRCYLGSVCSGLIKGMTCGGFLVLAIIDYFVIMYNCLIRADKIKMLGMHAKFNTKAPSGPDDVTIAFYISLGFIILYCFCGGGGGYAASNREKGAQAAPPAAQSHAPPPAAESQEPTQS